MSNRIKGLKALTLIITMSMTGAMLAGCEDDQQVTAQQTAKDEVVYVQNDDGDWVELAMFMMLMNNNGTHVNYNNYHYSTRSSNGSYAPYKPSKSEFTSLSKGTFSGKTKVTTPAPKTTTTPKTTVTAPKSTTGTTSSLGDSSTRTGGSTSSGFGG